MRQILTLQFNQGIDSLSCSISVVIQFIKNYYRAELRKPTSVAAKNAIQFVYDHR